MENCVWRRVREGESSQVRQGMAGKYTASSLARQVHILEYIHLNHSREMAPRRNIDYSLADVYCYHLQVTAHIISRAVHVHWELQEHVMEPLYAQ